MTDHDIQVFRMEVVAMKRGLEALLSEKEELLAELTAMLALLDTQAGGDSDEAN